MIPRRFDVEAAGALLDTGVSLPFFKIFGREVRLTMKRPYLGGLIRYSKLYGELGHTFDEIEAFSNDEALRFVAEHGWRLSRMIALMICRGAWSGALFVRPMSWLVRVCLPPEYLVDANAVFGRLLQTRPFTNIIRSIEVINPMRSRLSLPQATGGERKRS